MNSVIERGVVDGVTALRSKGVPGRHLAALTFRVGRFDETLPAAGITHMVEHLTLSRHQEADYKFNASVSGRHTTLGKQLKMKVPDPVFNVRGIKTRRVEPRNAPTVINAIFNDRNFWDGRAQSDFNGVDPFGSRSTAARVHWR